jgi:hypothetical protein
MNAWEVDEEPEAVPIAISNGQGLCFSTNQQQQSTKDKTNQICTIKQQSSTAALA